MKVTASKQGPNQTHYTEVVFDAQEGISSSNQAVPAAVYKQGAGSLFAYKKSDSTTIFARQLSTVGDGNCLIHALFGDTNDFGYIEFSRAEKFREELCEKSLEYERNIASHISLRSFLETREVVQENQNVNHLALSIKENKRYLGLEHVHFIAKLYKLNVVVYIEDLGESVELFENKDSHHLDHFLSFHYVTLAHWSKCDVFLPGPYTDNQQGSSVHIFEQRTRQEQAGVYCIQRLINAVNHDLWDIVDAVSSYPSHIKRDIEKRFVSICLEREEYECLKKLGAKNQQETLLGDSLQEALHIAIAFGDLEAVKIFLDEWHLHVDLVNSTGKAPLFTAIDYDIPAIVTLFLERRANVMATWKNADWEFTPLTYCIRRGSNLSFDLLVKHLKQSRADTHIFQKKTYGIGNLFHIAIQFGQVPIIKHLLNVHYTDVHPLLNEVYHHPHYEDDFCPIHLAAALGDVGSFHLFVQRNHSLVGLKTQKGRNVLHIAVMQDEIRMVQHIYDTEPRLMDGEDNNNKLPKDFSVSTIMENVLFTLTDVSRISLNQHIPNLHINLPQTLVFQGGGPKGLAYVGALQELYEKKLMGQVQRIAGTSAGAITATLVALGCTPEEVKELSQMDLTHFLDAPSGKREIINVLLKPSFSAFLELLFSGIHSFGDLISIVSNAPYFCEGKAFRNWIEDIIYQKTGVKDCTFGEFDQMRESKGFKHLHMFGSRIDQKAAGVRQFSSENSDYHQCRDVVIADAIRISMSVPGLFKPHTPYYKKGGQLVKGEGMFVDGGLIYNFPIYQFDNKAYIEGGPPKIERIQFNRHVLGFSLYSPQPEDAIENVKKDLDDITDEGFLSFISNSVNFFLDAESHTQGIAKRDDPRIIRISNVGVGLLDFELEEERKKALIESGRSATEECVS